MGTKNKWNVLRENYFYQHGKLISDFPMISL